MTERMQFGEMYDGIDADGTPYFSPQRVSITDDEERKRLSQCLRNATLVFAAMTDEADVLSGDGGRIGVSYSTDGSFVWRTELADMVQRHGVAPDEGFYAHIRSHKYQLAAPEMTDELEKAVFDTLDARPA